MNGAANDEIKGRNIHIHSLVICLHAHYTKINV